MIIHINKECLQEITVLDYTLNTDYIFKPAKRGLFGLKLFSSDAYVTDYWFNHYSLKEFAEQNSSSEIVDNKIYYKPTVKIKTTFDSIRIWFDTYEEAVKFSKEFIGGNQLSHNLLTLET